MWQIVDQNLQTEMKWQVNYIMWRRNLTDTTVNSWVKYKHTFSPLYIYISENMWYTMDGAIRSKYPHYE